MYPVYLRAEAFLGSHQAPEAIAEFQKFMAHRGVARDFPLGAPARLGLARAYAMQGETVKARAAYRDFLTLWKDADVGDSCDVSFSCRAFLWQDGTMTVLNNLVHDRNAPSLENANSINSRGQIAGKTTVQGTPIADAYLATPSHGEPDSETAPADPTAATSQRPRVVLPENVRRMLRQRLSSRYHIPGIVASPRE